MVIDDVIFLDRDEFMYHAMRSNNYTLTTCKELSDELDFYESQGLHVRYEHHTDTGQLLYTVLPREHPGFKAPKQ